jgi:hypothetical protein
MTQQETIAVLQEFYDYNKTLTPHGESWLQADITINRETQRNLAEALPLAIEAMSRLLADPKTGLVPCGCGGKAHIINSSGYSRRLYVECDRCAIMLGVEATGDGALQGIYRYDDQIIKDWNTAMSGGMCNHEN